MYSGVAHVTEFSFNSQHSNPSCPPPPFFQWWAQLLTCDRFHILTLLALLILALPPRWHHHHDPISFHGRITHPTTIFNRSGEEEEVKKEKRRTQPFDTMGSRRGLQFSFFTDATFYLCHYSWTGSLLPRKKMGHTIYFIIPVAVLSLQFVQAILQRFNNSPSSGDRGRTMQDT